MLAPAVPLVLISRSPTVLLFLRPSLCSSICLSLSRYLKPDVKKKSKHKTAVIKKTLNPEFNEVWMCLTNCRGARHAHFITRARVCVVRLTSVLSVNEMSGLIFLCAAFLLTFPEDLHLNALLSFMTMSYVSHFSHVLRFSVSPSPPSRLSHARSIMWAAGDHQ